MMSEPFRRLPGPVSTDDRLRPPAGLAHSRTKDRNDVLLRWSLVFLTIVAASRYDSTSFVFRQTETIDAFNFVWRYRFWGAVSSIDVLLVALLALAAWKGHRKIRRGFDLAIPLLAVLVTVSVFVRFSTQGYGDTVQDFLFQLRNYLYLAALYFVARRIDWTERRFRKAVAFIAYFAGIVLLLGFAERMYLPRELQIYKYGRYSNARDVNDAMFILFTQFCLLALFFGRHRMRPWQRVGALAMIGYTFYEELTGVGKTVLFVCAAYFVYLAWQYRLHRRLWFLGLTAVAAIALLAGTAYLAATRVEIEEGSSFYIYTTFTGEDPSVSTRNVETANFFLNLDQRRAWLQGLGLGTRWFEYQIQPEDKGAYPLSEKSQPWHLGTHVPLLRLAYDFGLVGLALVLGFFAFHFFRSLKFLRRTRLHPVTRALVHAAWLPIAYELFVDSLAIPRTNLVIGFLFGAIRGLQEYTTARGARSVTAALHGGKQTAG